jgi:hypothetical protein
MSGYDPIDELAALFLTEPDDPPAAHSSACELLIVGSLPVRASVWLAPYADAVAREAGPVALLRLDGEAPTVQVIRGEGPARPASRSLSGAVADLAPAVGAWIVRPAAGTAAADLLDAGADRIVVLSSVNESAIVRAYQEIKSLWTVAEARRAALPPLGLAVLGSDRHGAELFHRRLSHAASTALGVELSLAACVQRIDATMRTGDVLAFPGEDLPDAATVLGWIRASRGRAVRPREAVAAAAPRLPASPGMKLEPKPAAAVEPRARETAGASARDAPARLAPHVEGLAALDVRCPGHDRLEIAADGRGRLHVLALETDLRALHVVAAWARAHRDLIARACPEHALDASGGVVLHVFTDRPASVADLHGSGLVLHALAPVTVEGRRGWYHAPLNEPRDD